MKYVPFTGEINGRSIERLMTRLGMANTPGCVFVDSPGGTFDFFSVVAPAIKRKGIITLSGDVRSAAVILFLLGRARYAFPDATFFFHEVRALVAPHSEGIKICNLEEVLEYKKEMEGQQREAFQEWLRRMNGAQDWFVHFVAEATGLSVGTFLNLMRSEATLTAKEAVRYGIVHEILPEEAFRE